MQITLLGIVDGYLVNPKRFEDAHGCFGETNRRGILVDTGIAHDLGVRQNDPDFAIPWPVPETDAVHSDMDLALSRLTDISSPFEYRTTH